MKKQEQAQAAELAKEQQIKLNRQNGYKVGYVKKHASHLLKEQMTQNELNEAFEQSKVIAGSKASNKPKYLITDLPELFGPELEERNRKLGAMAGWLRKSGYAEELDKPMTFQEFCQKYDKMKAERIKVRKNASGVQIIG